MSEIATPTTELEVKEVVRDAQARSTPLRISGGNTRLGLGEPVQAARDVSLAKLSGIELYEPGALTIVAKAGTPLSEITEALDAENQQLAFEPIDHRGILGNSGEPTIGGVVACNASGSKRIQAGACRDALLGVRFVDGGAHILRNGGRVMKNVTGYDLVKLMCGSYGTLGVLTEVAFKVLPKPECAATVVVDGLSDDLAIAALSAALGSPYEVSGAAHVPSDDGASQTVIRVEGLESQVRHRRQKLTELAQAFGTPRTLEGDAHHTLWQGIRDAERIAAGDGAIWRISVSPSDGSKLVAQLKSEIGGQYLYDLGGGLVWAQVSQDNDAHADAVRNGVREVGGHATLVRASDAVRSVVPVFEPQHPRIHSISQSIKKSFDPAGILNPGRMSL